MNNIVIRYQNKDNKIDTECIPFERHITLKQATDYINFLVDLLDIDEEKIFLIEIR